MMHKLLYGCVVGVVGVIVVGINGGSRDERWVGTVRGNNAWEQWVKCMTEEE